MENSKKKILVVEDNTETQLIIKVNIRDFYDVEITDNANSAVELLAKENFDCVILDINLNGELDGKVVLDKIRSDSGKDIPVIVTTAYDLPESEKEIIKRASNDYIEKPIEKERLLESLKKCLNSSNLSASQ